MNIQNTYLLVFVVNIWECCNYQKLHYPTISFNQYKISFPVCKNNFFHNREDSKETTESILGLWRFTFLDLIGGCGPLQRIWLSMNSGSEKWRPIGPSPILLLHVNTYFNTKHGLQLETDLHTSHHNRETMNSFPQKLQQNLF